MNKKPASKKNVGCLTFFLNLFQWQKYPAYTVEPLELEPEAFPYRVRDDFLSPAEKSFYGVLKSMMGEHFTICPKVSLADIFFVTRPNENRSAYNRINRKHVDFLICDPKLMTPRFAVELDDSSHARPERVERDEFVDQVFEAAGLALVHVPVRATYDTRELGSLFRTALGPQKPDLRPIEPLDPPVSAGGKPPFCPKCGTPMVLRTAQRGDQPGRQFYGCTNYPKCRVILPVEGGA